jgi:DNA-binding transcriptional LysR family regulator
LQYGHRRLRADRGRAGARDWTFRNDGATDSIRIEGRLRIPVFEGALAAAVADMGVVLTSTGASWREFDNGSLVRVLPDWDMGSVELHAMFPVGRAAKPSARVFADYPSEILRDV